MTIMNIKKIEYKNRRKEEKENRLAEERAIWRNEATHPC